MMTCPKTPRIILTGAGGYLGQRVLAAMMAANISVERLSFGQFLDGAIDEMARHRLQQADVVCHLAAIHPQQSVARPNSDYARINKRGTRKLLAAMRKGCRFVFASSAMAAGAHQTGDNSQALLAYARSKIATEADLSSNAETYVALRFQAIAGAHRAPCAGVISYAIRAASTGTPLEVFDQSTPREYLHIDDAAAAVVAACVAPLTGGAILDVGTGDPRSIFSVIRAVEQETGQKIHQVRKGRRPEPAARNSDLTMTQRILDWSPVHSSLLQIVSDHWSDYRLKTAVNNLKAAR